MNAECDLADALLRLGHGDDLVAELSIRATEHPLDERVAGQYMLAVHRAGRTADALAHYRQLRERLVEELGTDPGTALQDLHRQILATDLTPTTHLTLAADPTPAADPALTADLTATADVTPTTAPTSKVAEPVVPRQLPAAPAPFIGRRTELDRLDVSGSGGTVVISAIAGAGGIGKTWLALHWAHRHADRFPDGQLFVDLCGFGPEGEPMAPAVAVRGFLDALGVEPGRTPVDPHAQTALFRSLVADKRMLLVLDNAADAAQVIPLLPGSTSCTVVVTSRNRLPGLITAHSARHLPLDVLSDDEARALLTDRLDTARVEAEPAAVDQLVELCGGFPLALSIIAGHAHTHAHLSLAAIATELRDCGLDALDEGDPAASLPTVLSWSHHALTDDQATTFALLGVAPGPDISLPAAASLVGRSVNETRTVLRGLEQASLVSQNACGRYRMHDLIRRYATDTAHDLAAHVPESALRRVLDFYTHTAHAAAQILDPHRASIPLDPPAPGTRPHPLPDVSAALAWLDTEHANLLAAHHTAVTAAWHDVVWQMAMSLTTYHQRRGHLHDDLALWRAALDAAVHLPDPTTRTRTQRFLGRAYANLERHEKATEHLHQALALAEHQRDRTQQAHTHRMLAWAWEQQKNDWRAMEHATHALNLYRTLDQPVREADMVNAVGWYAARLGEYDTARDHCQAALALHRRHRSRNGEAATLDSLGYIDHHSGRHHEAIRHYEQALALFRDLGNNNEYANTLDSRAHPHAALGQYARARAGWREALELYRQQGRDQDAERVRRHLDALDRTARPTESAS